MKTHKIVPPMVVISGCSLLLAAGCSSLRKQEKPVELAATGPTVSNTRIEPSTIELNQKLQPTTSAEVLADVKDFRANVDEVNLRFNDVPLQVPMKNVGGTTWRAELTPEELQMLAVSGKTVTYNAQVVAKDAKGLVAMSSSPVEVAIKTPEVGQTATG